MVKSGSGKIWTRVIVTLAEVCFASLFQQQNRGGDVLGVWNDFSELKRENVVGKFITSYVSYAWVLRLKHGSHRRPNM